MSLPPGAPRLRKRSVHAPEACREFLMPIATAKGSLLENRAQRKGAYEIFAILTVFGLYSVFVESKIRAVVAARESFDVEG